MSRKTNANPSPRTDSPAKAGGWLLFVLALAWFVGGAQAQAGPTIRSMQIDGENYLLFSDVARFYGMRYSHRKEAVVCKSRYSLMTFTVDDRRAVINGVNVTLCLPVKISGRDAFLSEMDFRLTIDPVLRARVLSGAGVRTIVIDPGHGGDDPGAIGRRVKEKDVVLAVSTLVVRELRRRGYQAYLTRTGDQTVALRQRVETAARVRPDVFVSVHANSATSSTPHGIETFALTPTGTRSTYARTAKSAATPGNAHDRENMRLAYELQKYLLQFSKAQDRGVKRADFLVIRDAPAAAALVELGFLSNPNEENRLRDPNYQRLLASAIVNGIVAYDNALRMP